MHIRVEPLNPLLSRYSVTILEGDDNIPLKLGEIYFDDSDNQWTTDSSLKRCLEMLVSDFNLRRGKLGTELDKAIRIAMQIAGAWYVVTNETTANKAILLHKLDMKPSANEETLDFYSEWRPLENVSVGTG